jgi:hypothetical protein
MRRACLNIKFFLRVRIGSRVFSYSLLGNNNIIVLGDVVVTSLQGNHGGVFTYNISA